MDYAEKRFRKIKSSLRNMVLTETWDYLELSDLQYRITSIVMNTNSVDNLPVGLRMVVIESIYNSIREKYLKARKNTIDISKQNTNEETL